MKVCSKCSEKKDVTEYRQRKNGLLLTNCKECEREYQRQWYRKNAEKARLKARKSNNKRRHSESTREDVLTKQRKYYHEKAKYREKQYHDDMKKNEPWRWKAKNAKRNVSDEITEDWLKKTYKLQCGKCALSGRKIEVSTFHIDHIIPKKLGGSNQLGNLRLVCEEANLAKSGLLDGELIALCKDIIETQIPEIIGRAIMEIENDDN